MHGRLRRELGAESQRGWAWEWRRLFTYIWNVLISAVTGHLRHVFIVSARRVHGWDFGFPGLIPTCPRRKPAFKWIEISMRAAAGGWGCDPVGADRPPGRQACMACTGTEHMFGHAVLRAHAHAHAHTRSHPLGSGMRTLRAQRPASGCRHSNQAARRRLVENAARAASESRLSTLRSSTHAIA